MAKRYFELPKYSDLTKEQDAAYNLPLEGTHLVVGGPGSGKSVVALMRYRKYAKEKKHLFLTYNHVLNESCKQWVTGELLNAQTAKSWFCKQYSDLTNGKWAPERKPTPEEREKKTDMSYSYDYELIIKQCEKDEGNKGEHLLDDLHIVVDEGQDLPPGFYETLYAMKCENIFVVADQNQQIKENENSSVKELADILDVEIPHPGQEAKQGDVIYLKNNFRNTTPIAKFCNCFYTDRASEPPEIPERPSLDIPILYEYNLVIDCVKMILRNADNDPSLLIGVIVATDTKREDYTRLLQATEIERDNEVPPVSTYTSSQKQKVEIDFSKGGILVLCDKSVKGIEFDAVYIILDGLKMPNNDTISMKKRLYVMTSRARNKLVLFKGISCDKSVFELLPKDENILERGKI